MINNVVLLGRLTKDIELRKTESNKSVAGFSIAINDRFNKDHTDFINCVAWNQSAEYLNKYSHKGDAISVVGRISTRSYDGKNGKVYVTEVVADQVSIVGSKKEKEEEIGGVPVSNLHKATIAPTVDDCDSIFEGGERAETNVPNLDIATDDLPFY